MKRVSILIAIMLAASACLPARAAAVEVRRVGSTLQIATASLRVECNLATGRCDYRWPGGAAIRATTCSARLADGRELSTGDAVHHDCVPGDVTRIKDAFGKGVQIVVRHRGKGRPELRQRFRIYDARPFCTVQLDIVSSTSLASNYMAPLVCDADHNPGAGAYLDTGAKPRTLFVPFDNDAFVRYNSDYATSSHEVTAIYDNAGRHGFVLGSLSHDVWKTGFAMGGHGPRRVGNLRAYGGMTGYWTHDSQPHGLVSGTRIASPRLFVGFFNDWRDGLEAFGRANAALTPSLPWNGGVIFGWNSWAAYGKKVSFQGYMAASEFLKNQLQPRGFQNAGVAYLNLDSFWDNLTPAQRTEAVRRIHARGQRAGIYWTPFTYWGDDMTRQVEGISDRYTYEDIRLKDSAGRPLAKLDGGWPLDPSHPGTLQRIDWQLRQFVDWGFDFVKLDFINAGALEAAHYDPRAPTGIAAYNLGMRRIVADLNPRKIGRPFFISLSIAPLFPHGYAHSRRISCDAFGSLRDSEYVLNSLTYGWWINGTLYRFNDPDEVVLSASEAEARMRLHSAVIVGAVLLDGDDLTQPMLREHALKLLTNRDILALARSGRSFRPVEGDTGANAADIFVCDDGHGLYIAAFNYDGKQPATKELDLLRLGLNPKETYIARDLWDKTVQSIRARWAVNLAPAESRLWRIARQ